MSKVFSLPSNNYAIDNHYFSAIQYPLSNDGVSLENQMMTSGGDWSIKKSLQKAYGEFEERLSILKNYETKSCQSILKKKWWPYIDESPNEKQFLDCVEAINWGRSCFEPIPKELVYFSPDVKSKNFPPIDTTGLSIHKDLNTACDGAVLELIEKNSLVLSFLNKKCRGKIAEEDGISFFDISYFDPFISVLAIRVSENEHLYYSVGAASGFTLENCIKRAKNELIQLETAAHHILKYTSQNQGDSYGTYYLSRNNKEHFKEDWGYLFASPSVVNSSVETELNVCDTFIQNVGALFIYIYPMRSNKLITVKAISPDILWSLVPINGRVPLNRKKFLSLLDRNIVDINNINPIAFP